MIPFANTTITLYHRECTKNDTGKTVTKWHRSIFYGCRKLTKQTVSNVGGALVVSKDEIVQIPGKANIDIGDVLVKGVCDIAIPENGVAVQMLENPLTVTAVNDYTHAPLPHFAVTVR